MVELHTLNNVDIGVASLALENAASIAGMFLTTECIVVDKPEEAPAAPMNPGMGGMM